MAAKAKYLFIASMDVDPDKEALFNEVYVGERLLAAYTMTLKRAEPPVLHVAELSCPETSQ